MTFNLDLTSVIAPAIFSAYLWRQNVVSIKTLEDFEITDVESIKPFTLEVLESGRISGRFEAAYFITLALLFSAVMDAAFRAIVGAL